MKIKQQIYTRERGGIFQATDGYDTIAISEGLDPSFVKKYLHPICNYHSPKTLIERGEKDSTLYPEALTFIQPETGELIIGEAVFVPADFTGQRSTFFMHNYVIPKSGKESFIKCPAKLLGISGFKTGYDIQLGPVLPELDEIEQDGMVFKPRMDELLIELGITETIFKQLLFAVMNSISGKKKVFIALKTPIKDYSKQAKKLLVLLITYLPYPYRNKLGAMTFTSAPEGKKYIHIMFFEPGTINYNDRTMEKQYIFDFTTGSITGVDLFGIQHEYLEFAWQHASASETLNDFFAFAERTLSGLPEAAQLEIASYYQLTALYQTLVKGDLSFYKKNKPGFLNSLLKFLQADKDQKTDLVTLFIQLIQKGKFDIDSETIVEHLKTVLEFNRLEPNEETLIFINEILSQTEDEPVFHQLWRVIEADKVSYPSVLQFLNNSFDLVRLLERHLDEKFKPVTQMEDLLDVVKKLMTIFPGLVKNEHFKTLMLKKSVRAVQYAPDPVIPVQLIKDWEVSHYHTEFKDFMMVCSEKALLDRIDLETISLQDISTFGRISSGKLNVKGLKNEEALNKHLILMVLHDLFSTQTFSPALYLKSLSESNREQLRAVMKKVLSKHIAKPYFEHILFAFDDNQGGKHYSQLFNYLSKHADDHTMLAFINWTLKNGSADFDYRRSLKNYLIYNTNSIWKNKAVRKDLLNIPNYSLKKILKDVQTETASGFVKFIKKYGIHLSLGLGIIILGSGGYYINETFFNKEAKVSASKPSTPAVTKTALEETIVKEDPLATFIYWTGAEPLELLVNEQQLTFGFSDVERPGKHLTLTEGEYTETIDLSVALKENPFNESGGLLSDYSLYIKKHDFDGSLPQEIIFVARNSIKETFVWIYSYQSSPNDGENRLTPLFAKLGRYGVRLEEKKLTLLVDNGLSEEYLIVNEEFILQ
ncbi:MAG: hypothetical protein AB2392_17760 [Neobacillus sp.]